MDIINTNRLRVSLRLANRNYGERAWDWNYGTYLSRDHVKERPERTYYAHLGGIVAHVKVRPQGKTVTQEKNNGM